MTWEFGRIDLQACTRTRQDLDGRLLKPVPVDEVLRVYRDYCRHKRFRSVMPMIPGRFTQAATEVWGYYVQDRLVAWSMYRVWDDHNILSDHHAWDYRDAHLRLGLRSLQHECAIYRDRGYRSMYFESVEPYMLDIPGFEILGPHT